MDELAVLAGADPLQFRLGYLSGDDRATVVLNAVAHAANWKTTPLQANGNGPRPIGKPPAAGHATGRGLGFVRYENQLAYVATVVDVATSRTSRPGAPESRR
jgi:hypothetical protein